MRWAGLWSSICRRPGRALLIAAALFGLTVVAVVAGGLIPITASSGHWPVTDWFLHFVMRRSVVTHAWLIDEPPGGLDQDSLVMRGAGHYDIGCRSCHGAPGEPLPPIPQAMTPHPPELASRVASWRPRELFYIVKHGVKFTGMPGWPAQQRDDEVWTIVAFLRKLPDMEPDRYRDLAGRTTGPAAMNGDSVPAIVRDQCVRCHGVDGTGRGTGAYPMIAGQRLEYLVRALKTYADGSRHSGIMGPVAAGLRADDQLVAARYYAGLTPPPPRPAADAEAVARGSRLVLSGNPRRSVPACGECHLPGATPVNDAYPLLAGQYPEYLQQQLRLLRARQRGGTEYLHVMHAVVDGLSDDDIRDAAAFFATFQAPRPSAR